MSSSRLSLKDRSSNDKYEFVADDRFCSLPALNFTAVHKEEAGSSSLLGTNNRRRGNEGNKNQGNRQTRMAKGISSRIALALTFQRSSSSRGQSLPNRLNRAQAKDKTPFGSRAKTDAAILKAKEKVLADNEGLQIHIPKPGDRAEQIIMCGANSVFAEVIDLNSMIIVMSENNTMLSHSMVERFFEWFPPFITYIDRYMTVEEEFIIRPIETRIDGLKNALKPSGRMLLRGRIQRAMYDLVDLQDIFKPYLPAGQQLSDVVQICAEFTKCVVEYWSLVVSLLPPILRSHFTRAEVDKLRIKLVKHVANHVGYKDFLAIYTRWMGHSALSEWKRNVLLPSDYKFFSYSQWDRDMDYAHYTIAGQFGDYLLHENADDMRLREESKADFERARVTRLQMEAALAEEEQEYGEDCDYESEGGEKTPRSRGPWSGRTPKGGRSARSKTPRSKTSRGTTPRSANLRAPFSPPRADTTKVTSPTFAPSSSAPPV